MPRPAGQYGPNIEKRGTRFFVVLKVPKDAQEVLGRTRYIKALGTDSPSEARRKAPMLLTVWRAEIADARSEEGDQLASDAAWFRKALAGASTSSRREALLERNLSTTLRHRRFLFTDSFLLLWKWRVG